MERVMISLMLVVMWGNKHAKESRVPAEKEGCFVRHRRARQKVGENKTNRCESRYVGGQADSERANRGKEVATRKTGRWCGMQKTLRHINADMK
jgi:hypothetical protein